MENIPADTTNQSESGTNQNEIPHDAQNSKVDMIKSITPEELENPGRSEMLRYLQYLSILFSILFSVAGIIYFL